MAKNGFLMSSFVAKKFIFMDERAQNKFSSFFLKACNTILAFSTRKATQVESFFVNFFPSFLESPPGPYLSQIMVLKSGNNLPPNSLPKPRKLKIMSDIFCKV